MPATAKEAGLLQLERDQHWHAVHTRYQYEKSVVQALSYKGHVVFLPLYGAMHLWRGRPTPVQLPLFPGYVFIRGGGDCQLQILSTPGIIGIVKMGGLPSIVPAEQMMTVRRMVESGTGVEPNPFLQSGDRVQVTSGALQGLDGILVRTKGKFRLVVSLEMLGRSASVEIDGSCVQPVFQPSGVAPRPRLAATA